MGAGILHRFLLRYLAITDGGDMDARDFVRMRYEKRLRDGLEDGFDQGQPIGKFEKFTKVDCSF